MDRKSEKKLTCSANKKLGYTRGINMALQAWAPLGGLRVFEPPVVTDSRNIIPPPCQEGSFEQITSSSVGPLIDALGFERKSLRDLFILMGQEMNQEFKRALFKSNGYFYRLFSNENWEEWTERRSSLGKVFSAFIHDIKHPFSDSEISSLSSELLDEANAQAESVLSRSTQPSSDSSSFIEHLKMSFIAFDSFFPSIPGAQASSIDCSSPCEQPEGSYQNSCFNSTVTFLPEGLCSLQTYCASILAGLPPQLNRFYFYPHTLLTLGNQNGTLTITGGSPSYVSVEEANDGFKKISELQEKLNDSSLDPEKKEELEKRKKTLIGLLPPGSVIGAMEENKDFPEVIPDTKFEKAHARFTPLQQLARATGGLVGVSRNLDDFSHVTNTLLDYILNHAPIDQPLDIAFVLDTTSSMADDIGQVKTNLNHYLSKIKAGIPHEVRVALIEYRDSRDDFVNRIRTGLTADIDFVIAQVNGITTSGGHDQAEALYDALLVAQRLPWADGTRLVVAITDAPPHARTTDGLHDLQFVTDQYQKGDIRIAFYPIVTKTGGK